MGITNGGGAKLNSTDTPSEIEELEREIVLLPAGGIAARKIRGKLKVSTDIDNFQVKLQIICGSIIIDNILSNHSTKEW